MLRSLPQSRWILTNADADHANRVLSILGVEDCFQGIIDIRAVQFACKPEDLAFQRALALAGDPSPESCVLLDDSESNLVKASQLGFTTVQVGRNGNPHSPADYSLSDLLELPKTLPDLWERRF